MNYLKKLQDHFSSHNFAQIKKINNITFNL
jgi:hypothetical protein